MMNFLFNEQSAIEKMIKMKVVDNDNIFITIRDLARYNYFVNKLDKDRNYKSVLKYLQDNGRNVNEENVYQMIDDCVQRAKKYQFKQIDEICITKSELDFVESLNDIKQEKIAFVLLASAKYYDATRGTKKCTAYMRNSDICKLARITIPVKSRDVFMQFAYDKEVLSRHSMAASTAKKVLFVSMDDSDNVVLRLKESDFKDLAYTYLAYKTPHKFRRCVVCNCWIRRSSKDRRLCKECADRGNEEKSMIKEVQCIKCGKPIYVLKLDTETCRCEKCNSIYQKERNVKKNKLYRERNKIKNVTGASKT